MLLKEQFTQQIKHAGRILVTPLQNKTTWREYNIKLQLCDIDIAFCHVPDVLMCEIHPKRSLSRSLYCIKIQYVQ